MAQIWSPGLKLFPSPKKVIAFIAPSGNCSRPISSSTLQPTFHDMRVLAGMGQNNVREYINNYTMPDNCKINALAVFSLVGYLWTRTRSKVTAVSLSEKGQLL